MEKKKFYEKKINPEIPILYLLNCGIYDIDIKDCPTFKDLAKNRGFIEVNLIDLLNKFDVPILEEFIDGISEFENKKLVDVLVFQSREKNIGRLGLCNKNIENAHSAINDARANLKSS